MPNKLRRMTVAREISFWDELQETAAQSGMTVESYLGDPTVRLVQSHDGQASLSTEAPILAELWDNDEDAVCDND